MSINNIPGYVPDSSQIQNQKGQAAAAENIAAANETEVISKDKKEVKKADIRRTINNEDIMTHLLALKKPVTDENKRILMTMLQYGIEASEDSFESIQNLIKNREQNNLIESSIIAHSKGLAGNSKSINLIAQYLSHNVELTDSFLKAQKSLRAFYVMIDKFKGNEPLKLFTSLSAILADLMQEFKKFEKMRKNRKVPDLINKSSEFLQEIKFFQEFLTGLESRIGKMKDTPASINLVSKHIKNNKESLGNFYDNLILQLVLSTPPKNNQLAEEYFNYWLLPNPFVQGKKDIELLISKDTKNKKKINPEKNTIIIKCDTSDLGDLTIVIEVNEKKLFYKFYSNQEITKSFIVDNTADFKKSVEDLNYEVVGVQTMTKFQPLQKLLLPVFNLDQITRISTEV